MTYKIPQQAVDDLHESVERMERLVQEMTLPASTRFDRQKAIEDAIVNFNGDAVETMELLDALLAGLKNRYDGGLSDVEHEARQLREALDELDRTTCKPGADDAAYEDDLARRQWDE